MSVEGRAKRKTEPAPSSVEWPRQPLPAIRLTLPTIPPRRPLEPGHEKMCLMSYANNKGADQPAHLHSLISAFVVRCLYSIIALDSIAEISTLASFCGCAGRFMYGLVGNSRRHFLSCRGSLASETISSAAAPTILFQRHVMALSSSPTMPPVKMTRRDSPAALMITDDKPPTPEPTPAPEPTIPTPRQPWTFSRSSTSHSSMTSPTTSKTRLAEYTNIRSALQRPYKLSDESTTRDMLAT